MFYTFHKPKRPVTRVFIHCSASDNPAHDNAATMDLWHKQNGWSGIGYHIFIRKDGTVEAGRSLELTPAAQAQHNTGTIAICLHGLKIEKFTKVQKETLVSLCHEINRAYKGKITFHGHREVANKECPVIDYKRLLSLEAGGVLPLRPIAEDAVDLLRSPITTGIDKLETPDFRPAVTLRMDMKGESVKTLQKNLTRLGYFTGAIDGYFGNRTRAAVLAFQADNHLVADGVFGAASREALIEGRPREIAPERQVATVVDLAAQGSPIAKASINNKATGLLLAGGGVVSIVQETSGIVTQLTDSMGSFGDALKTLGPWIGIAVVIGGGFIVWQSIRAANASVDDYRSGKTS